MLIIRKIFSLSCLCIALYILPAGEVIAAEDSSGAVGQPQLVDASWCGCAYQHDGEGHGGGE